MSALRNTVLVLLVSLALATLATALTIKNDKVSKNKNSTHKSVWSHKLLQDWDNGWDVNFAGEPIDPNTACGGKPCIRSPLTKPKRVAPVTRETSFCRSPTGDEILCQDLFRYLYEDVDDDEYTLNHFAVPEKFLSALLPPRPKKCPCIEVTIAGVVSEVKKDRHWIPPPRTCGRQKFEPLNGGTQSYWWSSSNVHGR
ncbi:hypothetical protein EDD21DRAFT_107866 [Dissophora ornata]|nr:hypothetical protein EDD21DRAFT_107866 [Dissophora ornata]